jgi:hypothetical protein
VLTVRALAQLTRKHAKVFEAEAAKLSDTAEQAMRDLDEQIQTAVALWNTARAAWTTLEVEQYGGSHGSVTPEELRFGPVPAPPLDVVALASVKARPADR